jgi:hypothetical protein
MQKVPNTHFFSKDKQNPFAVPENYLESLAEQLQQIPKQHPTKNIFFTKRIWMRTLAIAASLLLCVTIGWLAWQHNDSSDITSDDIIALTANGYIPNADLAYLEFLDDEDLDQLIFENDDLLEYFEYTEPEILETYYLTSEDFIQ